MSSDRQVLNSEDLAIWYLRLNGFFTIKNFVVHPEKGPNQETEIDALAIRLPYRAEGLTEEDEMIDDSTILSINNDKRPLILIAEVKKGFCEFNDTWINRDKKNIERFLKAIGCTPKENIKIVADALYNNGIHKGDYTISLICFGKSECMELKTNKPEIRQVLWRDVLGFIYDRFDKYPVRKSSHKQWDATGHMLWDSSHIFDKKSEFIRDMLKIIV